MLKIKGWLRAAALCVAFCLLLTGCSIPMQEETVQVEELLRAPAPCGRLRCTAECPERLAGGERPAEIPDARATCSRRFFCRIWTATASRMPLFSTPRPSPPMYALLFRRRAAACWQVSQTVEGLADTVDNVRLAQLQAVRHGPAGRGVPAASQDDQLSGGVLLRERRGVGHPGAVL